MEKKKELDILYERKAKADAMYAADATKIPLKQMQVYLGITERISILEDIKFILMIAPETMNPDKYKEHASYALEYVRKRMCFNENMKSFYLSKEVDFKGFVPKNVKDYKLLISKFMIDMFAAWQKEKNNK